MIEGIESLRKKKILEERTIMGKPATDWFCRNGHHVDSAVHHYYCTFDMLGEGEADDRAFKCPICNMWGSTNFAMVLEWNDPEYGDTDDRVPHTPIRYEDISHHDYYGNTYFTKEPVYDVSKLFAGKKT